MIKLKNLIVERRSRSITAEVAVDAVKNHCKTHVELHESLTPIYRGVNLTDQFLFVDPSQHERVSKNSSNHYTMIIDVIDSWKNYPKRSKSIICSTNNSSASSYGSVYVVIPYDGAKIGMCPVSDFWDSFKYIDQELKIVDLADFNSFIKHTYNKIFDEDLSNIKSLFLKQLEKFNDYKYVEKRIGEVMERYRFAAKRLTENGNIMETLSELFDPENNGLKLFDYINFKTVSAYEYGSELWTDTNSILVKNGNVYDKFISGITNQ